MSDLALRRAGSNYKGFSFLSLALEQLLTELDDFLKILDQENLSSTAVVKKSSLAELLRVYTKSSSKCDPGASERSSWKQKDSHARAATTKPHRLGGLNNRNLFPQSSGGQKFEIKALGRVDSFRGLLLWL